MIIAKQTTTLPSIPQSSITMSTLGAASSATPRILSRPRGTQESRIRVRLLHSLGIEPQKNMQKRIRPKPMAEPINYFKTVSAPFLQPLQDSIPRATSTLSASFFSSQAAASVTEQKSIRQTNNTIINNNNSKVRFDDDVLVVPIPSRHAYSDRIKRTIWRDARELRDIVDRNRYEYTFEGWESSKVIEDDAMYVDVATGEKVHPCWVEHGESEDVEDSTE